MEYCRMRDALSYQDKVLSELYDTTALVNAAKTCCQVREFQGDYYGIPQKFVPMLSNERNEYISILTIISDKLNYICDININKLHKNTDYCSGHVAAECTDD